MPNKVDLSYGGLFRLAVTLISVAMVTYHVWAIAFGSPEAFHFRGTHLAFALTLVFLLYRRSGIAEGLPTPLDYVLLVLSLAPIAYLFANYDYFINRMFYVDELSWGDMIMGTELPTDAVWKLDGWGVGLSVDASVLRSMLALIGR